MNTAEGKICGKCGKPIPGDSRWGVCPSCLMAQNESLDMAQPESDEPPFGEGGRRVGDYILGRQIGRGGMGVVYEARQLSLRRMVAVKMILESCLSLPEVRQRFAIEAEAAAKLDHPHIVPIYEIGEHRGQPFLTMKLVAGESLRSKIARGEHCLHSTGGHWLGSSFHARQIKAAQFIAEVAHAVHHAHLHGVVHRDIKPGNILVDAEGQPVVSDFGLAKIFDPSDSKDTRLAFTISGEVLGTACYMAPEQASGRRVSTACDVYGLGAVLYELLTGVAPFKADTLLETLRLVTEQEAVRPRSLHKGIHPDLDTICMKCLEKNPDARYPSAQALAEDLERWIRHEPIRARPVGAGTRAARWIRRNPIGAGLILSLCVGLIISLDLLHMAYKQKERDGIVKRISTYRISRDVQEIWKNPEQEYVQIESSELDAMLEHYPRLPTTNALYLVLGLSISDDPVGRALAYGPLLKLLEDQLAQEIRQQVFIHLRLYRFAGWELHRAVLRKEVDFARISALPYARTPQAKSGMQPVVEEVTDKEAVIFARKELNISTWEELVGKRMLFAHTNSIISFMAKMHLARHGILGQDLAFHANLSPPVDWLEFPESESSIRSDISPRDKDVYAHKEVIRRVLSKEFDVGVARRRDFNRNHSREGGLTALFVFDVKNDLHVARPELPKHVVQAYRRTMLSLAENHAALLVKFQTTPIKGYRAVSDADYQDLQKALTNEVERFEHRPGPTKN